MDAESRMLIWHDFHAILHDEQPYTFVTGGSMDQVHQS